MGGTSSDDPWERVESLRRQGRWQDALRDLEALVEAEPDNAEAWYWWAVTQDNVGMESTAIPAYRRALELGCSRSAEASAYLASSLQKTWRAAEALPWIEAALTAEPDVPLYHQIFGCVLADLGRWAEALAAWQRALELDPTEGRVWHLVGQLCGRLGRDEEAKAAYREAYRFQDRY
jgi:tetratricopeptide (TPR) repeat protein